MNDTVFKNEITDKESQSFYIIKALAMLSVIASHVNSIVDDAGWLTSAVTNFWSGFSIIGVVAFLISSGFFYQRKKGDTISFWKKKLVLLGIPWIIFSIVTYVLSYLINKQASAVGYLKWVFGYGTWFYYMTVLVLMYIIFKFIGQNDLLLYFCIFINVVAISLYTIFKDIINMPFEINYLNIFNWIGFFAIGVLMRKYRLDRKILKNNILFYVCVILLIIDCFILEKIRAYTYFHIFSLQYEITFFIVLLYLGHWLASCSWNKIFLFLGKNSFFIYLTHIQIVQFTLNKLPQNNIKYFFSPLIGLMIMIVIIVAVKFIAKKTHCSKLLKYIGIR